MNKIARQIEFPFQDPKPTTRQMHYTYQYENKEGRVIIESETTYIQTPAEFMGVLTSFNSYYRRIGRSKFKLLSFERTYDR